MDNSRLTLRDIFLNAERRPEVYFYTSNLDKYLQAALAFSSCGLPLRQFKTQREPYDEDYSGSKEHLLQGAVKQVTDTIGHASLVFIEDTSLRIEALSDGGDDAPGLRVKEWFAETTFDQLDQLLKSRQNDRRCCVKSDIALYVPNLGRPIFFHGETMGRVAETAPSFDRDWQHPWLTPNSFNGWFIPDGAVQRLGEMDFENSVPFDFRLKAFSKLIDFIESLTAGLNLPPRAYHRRSSNQPSNLTISLFPAPIYVVVGPTCVGKTTLAEYAQRKFGAKHVEASSIVRMLVQKHSITGADDLHRAQHLLNKLGKGIVADTILDDFEATQQQPLIISGLRTVEELQACYNRCDNLRTVVLAADERVRFARHLKRARGKTVQTLEEFRRVDEAQREFGLLAIAEDFADYRITNEGSFSDFYQAIDALISGTQSPALALDVRPSRPFEGQLYRCLKVLDEQRRPMTTDEIGSLSGETGTPIRHNNANKVLRRAPGLVRRIDGKERIQYEILTAGSEYVRLVELQAANNKA